MRIVYFAWLRERVGTHEEVVDLPSGVETVGDVITYLTGLDEEHAHAFAEPTAVRAALDRQVSEHDAPIAEVREIAFFPPMTGG